MVSFSAIELELGRFFACNHEIVSLKMGDENVNMIGLNKVKGMKRNILHPVLVGKQVLEE